MKLSLDVRRDVGEILSTAWSVWMARFAVLFTLTLAVVLPFAVLIDGLWAGTLFDAFAETDDPVPIAAQIASSVSSYLVIPPLVTAVHVLVVIELARGERHGIGTSAARALRAFPRALAVVALYLLSVVIGLALLVIPGVYISVRWYFGAQAAVVDGARGADALARSHELVADNWWRSLGILMLTGLVGGLLGSVAGLLFGLPIGLLVDSDVGAAVGNVLGQVLALSYTALAATLLFFDLRARREGSMGGDRMGLAPERPAPAP